VLKSPPNPQRGCSRERCWFQKRKEFEWILLFLWDKRSFTKYCNNPI
jgi:hypothetical protein